MPSNTCPACGKHFTAVSSLKRHQRQYCLSKEPATRKRACRECAAAKSRCDLDTPQCGRCASRKTVCTYTHRSSNRDDCPTQEETRSARKRHPADPEETGAEQGDQPAASTPDFSVLLTFSTVPEERTPFPELVVSPERRRVLLHHTGTPGTLHLAASRTMHLVVRVLKSWARTMASSSGRHGPSAAHLPPMIHPLQLQRHGDTHVPQPLAHCCTLARMWANQAEGSAALVYETVRAEFQHQLQQMACLALDDTPALLAASQAVLVLLIILLFGFDGPAASVRSESQMVIDVWAAKERLTESGLMLAEESTTAAPTTALTVPSWHSWVLTAAKRRTLLALHHVEWAWSLMRGYPVLSCFELGPLPAPDAGFLWRATDEDVWARLYGDWVRTWAGQGGWYRMADFFNLDPTGPLRARTEMWLAEADEFGMLLMAEINAVGE